MDNYRQDAELFLGGVSVISDDLIRFVKQDLKIFGIGVAFFLIITLSIIFRKIRWVVLPMLCCVFSVNFNDGTSGNVRLEGDRYIFQFYIFTADHYHGDYDPFDRALQGSSVE